MSEAADKCRQSASDPPFIVTAQDKQRWDLCQAIAAAIFEEDSASVWMAARALFQSELNTDEPRMEA